MQVTQNGRPMTLGKWCPGMKYFAGYCPSCKDKVFIMQEDMDLFLEGTRFYKNCKQKENRGITNLLIRILPKPVKEEVIHRATSETESGYDQYRKRLYRNIHKEQYFR